MNRQNRDVLNSHSNATLKPYRADQKRTPLRELLPLETPLSVFVDPSNACNFKCVFCPTGDSELLEKVNRPKGIMKQELFFKLIDDMQAFPQKIKMLYLYKDGEPLANKSLPRMIEYAKQAGVVERIETTTNGSLLSPPWSEKLIAAGIDGVRISVYAMNDDGYTRVTQTTTAYETVRSNVEHLFNRKNELGVDLHVHCKIVDVGFTAEEKEQFIADFRPISDSVHIDTIGGWSNTLNHDMTLGLAPTTGIQGFLLNSQRKVCSEPFMKLAVNFNGAVSVCCVDWSLATVVGDINSESIVDIWNGKALREFRRQHLLGRREQLEACNGCHFVLGLAPYTELDEDAERLLDLY